MKGSSPMSYFDHNFRIDKEYKVSDFYMLRGTINLLRLLIYIWSDKLKEAREHRSWQSAEKCSEDLDDLLRERESHSMK